MGVNSLTIKHFSFPYLPVVFSLFMMTNFFTILAQFTFTSALSFNFTSFSNSNTNISYERAYPEKQVIQITSSILTKRLVGQATYFESMHLWDKASRNLTDFTTHFSFVIDSLNQPVYADGLAVFLAPSYSKIPIGANGSLLGLTTKDQALNSTNNPFVAVEFDI